MAQLKGLANTTRFSQGSSRLATLGFGAESLWDSREFPIGIGSNPGGQECPRSIPAGVLPYGTPERPQVLQSQRDCVLQPRVAESARLPWVSVRAIFNPNGVVSPVRHQDATPLGLADTTRFSQGSSQLATLGLGAESLWDSALIIPKGIGSIPSDIGATSPWRQAQERRNADLAICATPSVSVAGRYLPMFHSRPPHSCCVRAGQVTARRR